MASSAVVAPPLLRTRFTRLLGCRYPVVLPGMSWISTAELVAAVSNAGGLGTLASGPLSADETRQQIRRIRLLGKNKPFAVGATLLMPGATENVRVALDERVPCLVTSLGKADWIAQELHSYGGTLICTVTNRHHAQIAVDSGADALQVVGHEAAAHGGDVTSLCLIPALHQEFPDTPLIGAGGFATGRGLAAALALGADGVAMGSRFAVTQESPLHLDVKQAICNANESQTIYGDKFDGIAARVLETPLSTQLMARQPWWGTIAVRALQAARNLKVPLWQVVGGLLSPQHFGKIYTLAQFGAATQRLTQATIHGNLQEGVQFIGQAQGQIRDIPTVDELMQRIVQEARDVTLEQAQRFDNEDTVFEANPPQNDNT